MIKLRVLFADDEPDVRAIIEMALARDAFFAPRGCAAGDEALLAAGEWRPDLALLDLGMPVLDGAAVAARLRDDRRTAAIPIIFVTAHPPARERCRELGAVGVIAKPFDPLRLATELRRFVPFEAALAPVRQSFLQRLAADAVVLAACHRALARKRPKAALLRISTLAHDLAGAGGIYGFAGIGCEAAALAEVTAARLAGRAATAEVEHALARLLNRIKPATPRLNPWETPDEARYSAATA